MKVLVCGGRNFNKWAFLRSYMDGFHAKSPISQIIHGAAEGADTLIGSWASINSIPVQIFIAQWQRYGKRAGPVRNQQMLDEGKPDLVIAFPGGRGTQNMKLLAWAAKIPVLEVRAEGSEMEKEPTDASIK